MGSISTIISDLKFGRTKLLEAIEGLSQRELTETPIYGDWTIKDVLAHVIGWDQRVLKTLPLMLQNRASEVPGVEVDDFNQASVAAWRDKPLAALLAEIKSTHHQILEIISSLDHKEIDMRRERHNRIITIRSYVIDVMTEHEREHAVEIEYWRKELEQQIDPAAIIGMLHQNRSEFLAAISGLSEAELLDKSAVETWSVKDVVGHVADWEQRMLQAACHIYDPSLPEVLPVSGVSEDQLNEMMAARREGNSWTQEFQYLQETQAAVDHFIERLLPGDWTLRGPYPWPDDQGALAELVIQIAEHYTDHLPALERWRKQKKAG